MVHGRGAKTPESSGGAGRDRGLDTLRGLAMIFVLVLHATPEGNGPLLAGFNALTANLRMPLLAAIAGFAYAMRPLGERGVGAWLLEKANRLLLPGLACNLLFRVISLSPPYLTVPPLSVLGYLAIWPSGHYWFVQFLFVSFALVAVGERLGVFATPGRWIGATVLALGAQLIARPGAFDGIELPWAADGIAWLLGYVLLGLGLQRFACQLVTPLVAWSASILLALGLVGATLSGLGWLDLPAQKGSALSLVIGSPAALLLLHFRPTWAPLAWLGRRSMVLYLLHVNATSIVAVAAERSTWHPGLATIVGLNFVAGLALPLLAEVVLRRFALTRRVFLGRP